MRETIESSEILSEGGSRPLRWLFFIVTVALLALVIRLLRDRREGGQYDPMERVSRYTGEIAVDRSSPIAERREPASQAPISSFPPVNRAGEPEVTVPEAIDLPVQPEEPRAGQQDDLKRIEGIGPVYERTLREAGIQTFSQLAETPVERLREIFGDRRLADPSSWPEQAAMAARGDWDGLEDLRGRLRGGRRQNA